MYLLKKYKIIPIRSAGGKRNIIILLSKYLHYLFIVCFCKYFPVLIERPLCFTNNIVISRFSMNHYTY